MEKLPSRSSRKCLPCYHSARIHCSILSSTPTVSIPSIDLDSALLQCMKVIEKLPMILYRNDHRFMMTDAEFSLFVPMFSYLVGFAVVLIVSLGAWFLVVASGNAVHAFIMK